MREPRQQTTIWRWDLKPVQIEDVQRALEVKPRPVEFEVNPKNLEKVQLLLEKLNSDVPAVSCAGRALCEISVASRLSREALASIKVLPPLVIKPHTTSPLPQGAEKEKKKEFLPVTITELQQLVAQGLSYYGITKHFKAQGVLLQYYQVKQALSGKQKETFVKGRKI